MDGASCFGSNSIPFLSVLVHILAFSFLNNSSSPLKLLLAFLNALAVVSSTFSYFVEALSVVVGGKPFEFLIWKPDFFATM